MRNMCSILAIASCFNILCAWSLPTPESAPSEPDFTSTGGGTVIIGSDTFLIKITVYFTDDGAFIKNTTKVTKNGGTEHSYDNTTVDSPVNVVTEGVQIWVGTPGGDIIYPDTSWTQGGVMVPAIMIGMAGNDIIVGTNHSNGDIICGNGGDDTIVALGGPDQIWGGAGSDAVSGCDGNDTINGGADGDQLGFNAIRTSFDDGDGDPDLNETWTKGSGSHSVTVYDEVDFPKFIDGGGYDRYGGLWGCSGHDKIWGEGGADFIHGDGDQEFQTSLGDNSQLQGGSENDKITGGDGKDNMWGGTGDDTLDGGIPWFDFRNTDDVDYLFGGSGEDTVSGRGGRDYINGDADNDHLYGFKSSGLGVTDGSGTGAQFIDGGSSGEDIIEGASCKDDIMGGDNNDTISGGYGNDRIDGEGGVDTIHGNYDNDYVWGGAGDDMLYGDGNNDFIEGESDSDNLYGGAGNDRLVDIGTASRDWLFGDDSNLDGGTDEMNTYDGSNAFNYDCLTGYEPAGDTYWADDVDFVVDPNLGETWTVSAGPTAPADGTVKPTRP